MKELGLLYREVGEILACVETELTIRCSEEDLEQLIADGTISIQRQYAAAHRYVCDDQNVDGNNTQTCLFELSDYF